MKLQSIPICKLKEAMISSLQRPQTSAVAPCIAKELTFSQARALRFEKLFTLGTKSNETRYPEIFIYASPLKTRQDFIKKLDPSKPEEILPQLIQLIADAKINNEYAEVLSTALEKLTLLKEEAKPAVPFMEKLLDRNFFNPVIQLKKAIFESFLCIEPQNKVFIDAVKKSANNPFEINVYKEQIKAFINSPKVRNEENIQTIDAIAEAFQKNVNSKTKIPDYLMERMELSRSISNTDSRIREQAMINFPEAFDYVMSNHTRKPTIEDLKTIHKILTNKILFHNENIQGTIRGFGTELRNSQTYSVKFPASKEVPLKMEKFNKWYEQNYQKMDAFNLAAFVNKKLLSIHPFYDGNGRAVRLFTDWILASKGHFMQTHPQEYLQSINQPVRATANVIKKACVPIDSLQYHIHLRITNPKEVITTNTPVKTNIA